MKDELLPHDEFVTIWQESSSMNEVISKTGLKRSTAKLRATMMRKRGVELKYFRPVWPKTDWEALKNLAKSLTKNNGEKA